MSTDPGLFARSASPASGRASPNPRTERKADEDAFLKGDKNQRRYAAGIDKALASFESSHQEWADYIAFLGRLSKAIQAVKETQVIPHAGLVSLRLAQCLNPSLPSGVHQKALEVYTNIFELLKATRLGLYLQVFLPGLLPVLSFASLTVRPLFYDLFDAFILKLNRTSLRPALKSIILGLLPGIEDETSEDFERGLAIIDNFRHVNDDQIGENGSSSDKGSWEGYFWQCFFLAVMTSESKRQGALAFLNRHLPSFASSSLLEKTNGYKEENELTRVLSAEADATIRPEPGLLIRCFASGLRDSNILVQRGFLDLLVTHLPLSSILLQKTVQIADLDLLVSAAATVVLRRDMSLNRRLWAWFLGPEAVNVDEADSKTPSSEHGEPIFSKQANFFQRFGASSLQRCLMSMFCRDVVTASEKARPFRIASALMDRWEIGGYVIPSVLVPALDAAFQYSQSSPKKDVGDVVKSASLFFDGIESNLIWARITDQLSVAFHSLSSDPQLTENVLQFLIFVVTKFNVREEDMLTTHIPRTVLVALHGLAVSTQDISNQSQHALGVLLEFVLSLMSVVPERPPAATCDKRSVLELSRLQTECSRAVNLIKESSRDLDRVMSIPQGASIDANISAFLLHSAGSLFIKCLTQAAYNSHTGKVVDIVVGLINRSRDYSGLDLDGIAGAICSALLHKLPVWRSEENGFALVLATTGLWIALTESEAADRLPAEVERHRIELLMTEFFWSQLALSSPKNHVESVRMLWKLQRRSGSHHSVEISAFVTARLTRSSMQLGEVERFTTLWEHTIQHQNQHPRSEHFSSVEAEAILLRPLMIVVDHISSDSSDSGAAITAWLWQLPSLDRVLSALLSQMEIGHSSIAATSKQVQHPARRERIDRQCVMNLETTLDRLTGLLANSSPYTWTILSSLHQDIGGPESKSLTGIQALADLCVKMMTSINCAFHEALQRRLLRLLYTLFKSDSATGLRDLHVEDSILRLLDEAIQRGNEALQIDFLRLLSCILVVREPSNTSLEDRPSSKSSESRFRLSNQASATLAAGSSAPPPGLIDCIKRAIKAPSARLYLDYWMKFLGDVLSIYSQAIFGAMIPLIECFCTQIGLLFESTKVMALRPTAPDAQAPIAPLYSLLHGLELVLANAHHALTSGNFDQLNLKLSPTAPSFFNSSSISPFSQSGETNKMAKANDRLAVIICIHDAVEICFKMWSWASYGIDASNNDASSAATASFNAQRIRSRTKKMLEHLFTAEGLESIEVLASTWIKTNKSEPAASNAEGVFSLMNVLAACRPRNATPLILNALYSRINIEALEVGRRSTLTCDLTAADLARFLLKYVSTIEDDALDEIWSDCSAFLRDVLSNPMPHGQVLPSYLELTALLAEKIENTNFGERQRMHKELADLFSRLLLATFTVRPNAGAYDTTVSQKTGGRSSNNATDLLTSLIVVAPKLQTVLETNDKILNAVNSIVMHAISPSFHAKAFPDNIRHEVLRLTVLVATQSPDGKVWKREVGEAFADARFFGVRPNSMSSDWFPALRKWSSTEKTVVSDTLSRIVAPSAATLMFGVGANSARLAADRNAQYNLRRSALLLLANEKDGLSSSVQTIDSKTEELCTASAGSSPSCATRAEVFMVWRALFLSTSATHLAGMWPTMLKTLEAALSSLHPGSADQETYNNLSLLQACKFLDLLVILQPDDFLLQDWMILTNTIDAVYSSGVESRALVDEMAEMLTVAAAEATGQTEPTSAMVNMSHGRAGPRKPLLASLAVDMADIKAMPRDDFVRQTLLPFFSGLSMAAYEGTYQMEVIDVEACRADLLVDLMDEGTMRMHEFSGPR
ncbi:hypothetical protein ANO11243_011930 [Dothideomycetidae sp. 11243]|nr:hypothetical protein ANO11243_011930 [fungal sp. No.11243]